MKKVLLSNREHKLLVRVLKQASNLYACRYIEAVDELGSVPYDEFELDVARLARNTSEAVDSLWLKVRDNAEDVEGGVDELQSVWL